MAASSWNGQSFLILVDGRDPVVPWLSGNVLRVTAFDIPDASYDLIQTSGLKHRTLNARLWLESSGEFEALVGMLGQVNTVVNWPVQGGGLVNFSGMMLQSLSDKPLRRLTTSGEVYETDATWWSTT